MIRAILTAATPSPEQLANWSFFLGLLAGILLTLALTWLFSEYGIDWIVRRWKGRRSATVIDFTERRRLQDDDPPAKLTRQERLEGLADRGCDTWEEARSER